MYFIGYDLGSSSVKACLLDGATNKPITSAQYPKTEMPMKALRPGWAEQAPERATRLSDRINALRTNV